MKRFTRPVLILTLLAAVLGMNSARAAEPTVAPQLSVEGTAFVLKLPGDRVVKGTALQGATIQLATGNGQVTSLRLKSIVPDPQDPDILRHEYETPDGKGGWQPACDKNFYGETWGFPIALPVGHPGREGAITLTCSSGAVGKCVRFGYKPWVPGPHGEDLLPYHAACVHMVRADYLGDNQPHTKNGTNIDVYDRIGIQSPGSLKDPEYAFEAGWSPAGAVCVAKTRWVDVLTLSELFIASPKLAGFGACNEQSAKAQGALLFDRSRIKARLGE